jgi:hypothetical protein
MRAYHFVEHIDRPPQLVWDTLTDLRVAARWRPLVKAMETVDGQPLHTGSEIAVTFEFFGKVVRRVSTTAAFEPPRRWVMHSVDQPTIGGYFEFIVEPDGERGGTRVTATCELEARTFLTWLFLPLIARGERTRRVEMLPNLKRLVEALPV